MKTSSFLQLAKWTVGIVFSSWASAGPGQIGSGSVGPSSALKCQSVDGKVQFYGENTYADPGYNSVFETSQVIIDGYAFSVRNSKTSVTDDIEDKVLMVRYEDYNIPMSESMIDVSVGSPLVSSPFRYFFLYGIPDTFVKTQDGADFKAKLISIDPRPNRKSLQTEKLILNCVYGRIK